LISNRNIIFGYAGYRLRLNLRFEHLLIPQSSELIILVKSEAGTFKTKERTIHRCATSILFAFKLPNKVAKVDNSV